MRGQTIAIVTHSEAAMQQYREDAVLIFLQHKTQSTLCHSREREMLGCVICISLTFPSKQSNMYSICTNRSPLIALGWKEKQITSDIWWTEDVSTQSTSRRTFFLPFCFMSAVHDRQSFFLMFFFIFCHYAKVGYQINTVGLHFGKNAHLDSCW